LLRLQRKIIRKGADGRWLIANNRGRENGWTAMVYGRAVRSADRHGTVKTLDPPDP